MKCPQCGLVLWATAQACKRCGLPLAATQNIPPLFPAPQQPNLQQPYNNPQPFYQTQPSQPFVNQQTQPDFASQQTTSGYNYNYAQPQTPPSEQEERAKNFQSTYGAQQQNQENYQQSYQADYQQNYQQQNYNYGYNAQYAQPHAPNFGYPQNNLSLYAQKKKGLPTASMILGIVSLVMCGLLGVGPIVGFILGIIGWNKAKKEPQQYGGETMAIVGIGLNVLAFFVLFLAIARFAGTMPSNFSSSYQAANESSAISSVRTLQMAEVTYQSTSGEGKFGTLKQLETTSLIDSELGSGTKNGYSFSINVQQDTCEIFATPVSSTYGERSFYISCTESIIRVSRRNGLPASASDPPLNTSDKSTRRNDLDEDD